MEKTEIIEINNISKSDFTLNLPPNDPLVLGDHAEVALKSYFMFYTLPNISEEYNNNKLKVVYNGTAQEIVIPTGMYEIDQLSTFINRMTVLNRPILNPNEREPESVIKLEVDKSTFHCIIKLKAGVEIDFSEGKLHEMLGLEPRIYSTTIKSKNIINITRGVNLINIRCNLVNRKHQPELRDVLYSILPIASPGEAMMEVIDPLEYFPCKDRFIRAINIRITNEKDELILFKDNISLKIYLKHVVTS